MTTASDDEDLNFDDDDDELLAAALDDPSCSAGCQNATTSKYSDRCDVFDGFDAEAGKSWIYPTNYPLRDYQLSIVQKSLFSNTLVSLPTGLGKTFIAAVVMFNFYRWYPQGKIIFMAPTKPLVAQQIEACFNVMGIPQNHMAEMTGSMKPPERKMQWKAKRIFFLTPQVMTNDISRGNCPATLVKCLVVDEAHKALGNHPYAVVVKEVAKVNRQFRVLALSATPGGDIKAVQQIITNLLISNVEIRMEDSLDIIPYTHGKIIEKIIVPLGEHLENFKKQFMKVIMIYVERLTSRKVLWKSNPENLTKFALLKERDQFRQNPPESLPRSEFGKVEGDFAMSMSLYHAYELLQMHGLRSFYNFLKGILNGDKGTPASRSELLRNGTFCQLLQELEASFETSEVNDRSSTSTASLSVLQSPLHRPFIASHPKMQKLVEIMLEHFQRNSEESSRLNGSVLEMGTRAMVFSQYRDSVAEITDLLNRHQPLIKAMHFIGQSSGTSSKGLTQKLQLQVVSRFRNGGFNTLVSTCVGEEGLDIGEVDLIVCYDAHKSPIRLVQRIGRTGRKRMGRIIMLITKGKEERTYNQGQLNKRNIDRTIASGSQVYDLYTMNPRMIPANIHPVCDKMSIVTEKFLTTSDMRQKANSVQKLRKNDSAYLTEDELHIWNSKFKCPANDVCKPPSPTPLLSLKSNDIEQMQKRSLDRHLSLTDWLPWQNVQQPTGLVGHSKNTLSFVEVMQNIQIYTQLEDDNNSYGLELAPFFDKQDVLENPEKEVTIKSRIDDFFPVVAKLSQSRGEGNQLFTPVKARTPVMKSPRKIQKLPRILFSMDSDDDFRLTSPMRPKSDEKDRNRAKGSTLPDSSIASTSLQNPTDSFFSLPADFTEPRERLRGEAVPRVRLKTPPPSPPQDIVTFKIWLNSFQSTDKVQQGKSSKIPSICKQEAVVDDLFADLDLETWEEDEQEDGRISPAFVEALRSAPSSPVFNSISGMKNTETVTTPIGQRSMFSATQLVDMLHTDSILGESSISDVHPIPAKSTSKYSFKSLSKKVHKSELCAVPTYISKAIPATKVGQVKPCPASLHSTGSSHIQGLTERASQKIGCSNSNDRECPKMIVHPFVPSASPEKAKIIDSKERSPSEVHAKPGPFTSPIASVIKNDFGELDIIPPTPKRTDTLSKFKYKFKPKRHDTETALHLANSLCLSPIGIAPSKDIGRSALPARALSVLSASTPMRVSTVGKTSKMHSASLKLDDDDFAQCNRGSKRKLTSQDAEDGFRTSLPKRPTLKKRSMGRQYIEEEAEVCDVDNSSDEDEQFPGIDQYEESFIDDRINPTQFTQTRQDDTSTLAMYLRTLRSPAARPGAFKVPSRQELETMAQKGSEGSAVYVFSQRSSSDNSDYQNDSFCVDNDFVEYAQTQDVTSPARIVTEVKPTAKRRRIYVLDASISSSDEERKPIVKSISDPSDNFDRGIPKKTDSVAPKPGPSKLTTNASHNAMHHLPTSLVSSRVMHDPGPSTSAAAITAVPPQPPGMLAISKVAVPLTPSPAVEIADFRPVILVSSQEMASGQEIISNLNVRHRAKVTIANLSHCDYIISNRMAVERKKLSDVANSALRRPLLLRIREMISLFERPCLVIESDRVKPSEKPRPFLRSKYFDNTMACIVQTSVKILLSESQEDTAEILVDLSRSEFRKGYSIDVPLEVDECKSKHLKFYSTLPNISHVVCLNFCANFASIMDFLKSSVEQLENKGKISRSRAELLHRYLRHEVSYNV